MPDELDEVPDELDVSIIRLGLKGQLQVWGFRVLAGKYEVTTISCLSNMTT